MSVSTSTAPPAGGAGETTSPDKPGPTLRMQIEDLQLTSRDIVRFVRLIAALDVADPDKYEDDLKDEVTELYTRPPGNFDPLSTHSDFCTLYTTLIKTAGNAMAMATALRMQFEYNMKQRGNRTALDLEVTIGGRRFRLNSPMVRFNGSMFEVPYGPMGAMKLLPVTEALHERYIVELIRPDTTPETGGVGFVSGLNATFLSGMNKYIILDRDVSWDGVRRVCSKVGQQSQLSLSEAIINGWVGMEMRDGQVVTKTAYAGDNPIGPGGP